MSDKEATARIKINKLLERLVGAVSFPIKETAKKESFSGW